MELSIGPVLFEWKRGDLLRFYDEVCGMDVDRVYIGEVVCSKKIGLDADTVSDIAGRLQSAGKKVVLSSLAVVSNEEELDFTRRLLALPYAMEANDISVLNIVDPAAREVSAGPHITTYNAPSIEFLKGLGVGHVTFPVELSRDSIEYNIRNTSIEGEVFVHGKVPLAFSWRCYTSRAYGLTKTSCRRHCAAHPDGMELKTLEREPLFTMNGTSLLSAGTYTLVEAVKDLEGIGVKTLRVSPQHKGTARVVEIFRKTMAGELAPEEALAGIAAITQGPLCNGWYFGGAGRDYLAAQGV